LAAQQTHAQGTVITSALDAFARPTSGLVGLGTDGALLRSTNNGTSFTSIRSADSPRGLYAVAASGSTVIAMGDAGWFVRSTDNGQSYATFGSSVTPAFVGSVNAVSFANNQWVAVGKNGTLVTALGSGNGTTWAAATISGTSLERSGVLRGLTWTGARWVAVGGNGASTNGFIFTSNTGTTWTRLANAAFPSAAAPASLNAVASDGAGNVLAVGKAGTMLYSSDGGLTYTDAANGIVSEDLYSVLFRSGTKWVAGGDSAVLVDFDSSLASGSQATIPYEPVPGARRITALIADTVAGNYLYSSSYTPPPPVITPGPISLSIETVSNQLRLTLVGATNTVSYYTESSVDLITWTPVGGSTRTFNGVDPLVWTYALPAPGGRVFYRAKSGSTP
jgi:photosystem II stability/assembly factor-like uncharacterized protein